MAKNRRNHRIKDGYWAGWRDFRYGDPDAKPISLAGRKARPLFSAEKRKHILDIVIDFMRDWRETPFEREGEARTYIRVNLCLHGQRWDRADQEAGLLTADALSALGAVRPSPEQGQREYTFPREYCANCFGPLDEDEIARRSRFCSVDCRRAMRAKNIISFGLMERKKTDWAAKQLARDLAPRRPCEREGCGKFFKSVEPDARYCSLECFHAASTTVQSRECTQCGRPFRPSNNITAGRFCSVECTNESFRQTRVYAVCECCGESFIGGNILARYCSNSCKKLAGRIARGEIKRISPPVFDYIIRMAA